MNSYDDLDQYDLIDETVYERNKERVLVAVNGKIESHVPVRPGDIARELGTKGLYIRNILRREFPDHIKHQPWFLTLREGDFVADERECERKR